MRPVEARRGLLLDQLLDHARDRLELFEGGVVRDAEGEDHAPLLHPPVVVDARVEQVAVTDHQLLAAEAAQMRRLDADALDAPPHVSHRHEVADRERAVEHDRERGEQVAEDALRRKRDRDPADAQRGDQRRDLHPEIVEPEDQQQRPEGQRADVAPRLGHAGRGEVGVVLALPAGRERDRGAAPEAALRQQRDEGDRADHSLEIVGQCEGSGAGEECEDQDDRGVGAPLDRGGAPTQQGHRADLRPALGETHEHPAEQQQAGEHGDRDQRRVDPVLAAVASEGLEVHAADPTG